MISTDTDLVIFTGAPQENDNNIEVVEAGAGPSQQAWPQPRGYGGPQTRPWGGPQSWTRPAPQWSGPMGYSAPNWARPAPQYQAYPQPQWSAPQSMVSSASYVALSPHH